MSSTVTRRGRAVLVAAVLSVGLVAGGALRLGAKAPGGKRQVGAPHLPQANRSPSSSPGRQPIPDMLLAWTPGGLPPGFSERVARFPGVDRLVTVSSGTAWLTRSFDELGGVVDSPPKGFAIPIEVGATDPRAYRSFVTPEDRAVLSRLARGEAALGATSARLRRLGSGGTLAFGDRRVRVAGILPDADMGAHEVLLSTRTATVLGITRPRYVLIDPSPGASRPALTVRIRSLLAEGAPLRVRGLGETPFFRQGDAVLPPIAMKQARQGLDHAIDSNGYGGCYVPRFINEDPAGDISHHSWGAAIDFNVPENPFGAPPHQDPHLVAIFEKWGFTWGGRWLVPDGMHFEFSNFPPHP
jgi:hypothetical protein